MALLKETIKRWRLPLVCCAWLFTLLGLLMRQRYAAFLAESFVPVIAMAALALLPLALIALMRSESPRFGMRELLATAVILLPLVYIHHSSGRTLGAGAFNTRYVGTGSVDGGGLSVPGASGEDEGAISLLTLFLEPEKYDGREIAVVGMLAKDNPQAEEIFGRKMPLLFRFVINCCAADATPVALVIEGPDADSLKNDDWIQASGTFKIRNVNGNDLLVMEGASVQATMSPAQPYLYMQWGVL